MGHSLYAEYLVLLYGRQYRIIGTLDTTAAASISKSDDLLSCSVIWCSFIGLYAYKQRVPKVPNSNVICIFVSANAEQSNNGSLTSTHAASLSHLRLANFVSAFEGLALSHVETTHHRCFRVRTMLMRYNPTRDPIHSLIPRYPRAITWVRVSSFCSSTRRCRSRFQKSSWAQSEYRIAFFFTSYEPRWPLIIVTISKNDESRSKLISSGWKIRQLIPISPNTNPSRRLYIFHYIRTHRSVNWFGVVNENRFSVNFSFSVSCIRRLRLRHFASNIRNKI